MTVLVLANPGGIGGPDGEKSWVGRERVTCYPPPRFPSGDEPMSDRYLPLSAPRFPVPGRWVVLLAVFGIVAGGGAAADDAVLFRVETEVFADDEEAPVARSLTLFRNGIAWDFLETLSTEKKKDKENAKEDDGSTPVAEPAEFVLHDPARERIILVDPARDVRTQVDRLRLERLRTSLGNWARKSEDPLMRWAGGPEFDDGLEESATQVLLSGPRVRYEVTFEKAGKPMVAEEYRRFADAALLVKALVHPGGLPPFPRIAINRTVAAADGIPVGVRLEIDSRMAKLGRRPSVMRSEHKILESWLATDHKRVAAAEERMAVATPVDLATYAGQSGETGSIASEQSTKPR